MPKLPPVARPWKEYCTFRISALCQSSTRSQPGRSLTTTAPPPSNPPRANTTRTCRSNTGGSPNRSAEAVAVAEQLSEHHDQLFPPLHRKSADVSRSHQMLDAFINHINTTTALTGLQPIPAGRARPHMFRRTMSMLTDQFPGKCHRRSEGGEDRYASCGQAMDAV